MSTVVTPAFLSATAMVVRTVDPAYSGTQVVRGHLFVNVVSPLATDGIYLQINGHESASWSALARDRSKGDKKRVAVHHHENSREIFNVRAPIHLADDVLQPGHYLFPFEFELPRNVPGSFADDRAPTHPDISDAGQYRARVSYAMTAEMVVRPDNPDDDYAVIRATCDLIVKGRPLASIATVKRDCNAAIRTWCCLNKGSVFLRVRFAQKAYQSGTTADLIVEFNNSSTVDVEHIKVELYRSLQMHGTTARYCRIDRVRVQVADGVQAGDDRMGDNALRIPLSLTDDDGKPLTPTTLGRVVVCRYWIEVFVPVPCGSGDIEARLPVTVIVPHCTPAEWAVNPLLGWDPVVSRIVNLDVEEDGSSRTYLIDA
ncbi:Arrestin C-terminal-like domain-containing protein [Plasmodiophora brassicae]